MQKERIQYLTERFLSGGITGEEQKELFAAIRETENMDVQYVLEELMQQETPGVYNGARIDSMVQSILSADKVTEQRGKVFRINRWAAAAVVLLVACGLWLVISRRLAGSPQADKAQLAKNSDVPAPQHSKAVITLADGSKVYLESAANGTLAVQANINVQKAADGRIVYHPATGTATEMVYNTLTNPRGSRVIDMQLSDGSRVWLNAGSSIKYPVAFTGNERKVEISGEGYFEVARHPQRKMPFRVVSGTTVTEVLGTHFNVNAYDDEEELKVTLLEGSVKLSAQGHSKIIKPGEQAAFIPGAELVTRYNIDVDAVMAWKNGYFHFGRADLKTIMRELARWYDLDVRYEGAIPAKEFGGEMQRDLPLSSVLKLLEKGGVRFRLENKKLTVLP